MRSDEPPLNVIGDIYDAALDAALWPGALQGIADFAKGQAAGIFSKEAIGKGVKARHTAGFEARYVQVYEERYADSAVYLAILSFAAYTNVALGFNGLTLRVYGLVRFSVAVNLIAAVTTVALDLLLIPAYGALGASVATALGLIAFNFFNRPGFASGRGSACSTGHTSAST